MNIYRFVLPVCVIATMRSYINIYLYTYILYINIYIYTIYIILQIVGARPVDPVNARNLPEVLSDLATFLPCNDRGICI
jgi:hypothetical protein